MVYCYVPYCGSTSNKKKIPLKEKKGDLEARHCNELDCPKQQERRHFFTPGKNQNVIKRWDLAIKRADRTLDAGSAICDLHFETTDMITEDVIVLKNGEKHVSPRSLWKLANDNVTPTKNLVLGK